MREEWLAELDPGIRPFVDVLEARGVETFESCQGGEGHASPEPMIRFHGQRGAGPAALAVAFDHALPVLELRRQWPIVDGEPTGPYWVMVFSQKAPC